MLLLLLHLLQNVCHHGFLAAAAAAAAAPSFMRAGLAAQLHNTVLPHLPALPPNPLSLLALWHANDNERLVHGMPRNPWAHRSWAHGLHIDCDSYASLLRQCGNAKDMAGGKRIHAHIIKSGLETDRFLANLLVQMYGKCGAIEDARSVFAKIHRRNAFSWTIMIGVYAHAGHLNAAFDIFQQMLWEGVSPDKVTFVIILSACANQTDLDGGRKIHNQIMGTMFESDLIVGNAIVNMYGKCGCVEDARRMFDRMPKKNVISWNSIITAYAQHGFGKEALYLFQQMQLQGLTPDNVTFASILDAFACNSSLEKGKRMHAHIVSCGFESDVIVATALVKMYGKCGSLEDARRMFDKMRERDVVSWNAVITVYAQYGQCKEAIQCFQQMLDEGQIPDKVTFINILNACASTAAVEEGKLMHARIRENGFESDVVVGNTLVNLYGKCGHLEDAQRMFDQMPERDVVSWNAMISAYAQHGHKEEVLQLFQQMQLEGVIPNKVTFVSVLSAFGSTEALAEGKGIHALIVGSTFESDIFVANAIISMYSKCGSLEDARRVFDQMHERDHVSWNIIIAAYAQNGRGKEAFQLFRQMQLESMMADIATFVCILDACANEAALTEGRQMHACIVDAGFESDIVVGTALVNMYGKCGSLEDAWKIFDEMPERDLVSWNAIIAAYAQYGHGRETQLLFQQMQVECVIPNKVTFISILSACSHSGLMDECCYCFVSMSQHYGIAPTVEHYNCMIDLFGRAGQLDEAESLINNMPFQLLATSWMTLLSACRMHFDVDRGKRAAIHIFELDPENSAAYVLLSNICAAAGRWDETAKVRKMMEDKGMKKQPGYSWIEFKNKVHGFFAGDKMHPQKEEIYAECQRLNRQRKEAGCMPDTNVVLHDVEEEEKEQMLCHHSEKLAIALGLINTPPGMLLRIINNLRVCSDCHSAIKFISQIAQREIIVRDANRFHYCKNGLCSCTDYW